MAIARKRNRAEIAALSDSARFREMGVRITGLEGTRDPAMRRRTRPTEGTTTSILARDPAPVKQPRKPADRSSGPRRAPRVKDVKAVKDFPEKSPVGLSSPTGLSGKIRHIRHIRHGGEGGATLRKRPDKKSAAEIPLKRPPRRPSGPQRPGGAPVGRDWRNPGMSVPILLPVRVENKFVRILTNL